MKTNNMKNIYLLTTDKPSKLFNYIERPDKFFLDLKRERIPVSTVVHKNIYITSDKEITGFENNIWVYNNARVWLWQNTMAIRFNDKPKKIILTTDPDLIADGVQEINDDFLQWFIKNPSCELVEVNRFSINCSCANQSKYKKNANIIKENTTCHLRNNCETNYKIILPKEESNKDLEKEMFELEEQLDIPSHLRWHNSKPEQETLEEVELATLFHNTYERLAPSFGYETRVDTKIFDRNTPNGKLMIAVCKEVIKWQAERMFSNEEVIELLLKHQRAVLNLEYDDGSLDSKKWFEKFKKK